MSARPSHPPLFSIIIPVFNRAARLPHCLDTVRAQEGPSFEIILADDGSTDNIQAAVQAYRDLYPSLSFTLVHLAHEGPGAAREAGARAAQGDILVYLDSDDAFRPGALASIAEALQEPTAQFGLLGHHRLVSLYDRKGKLLDQYEDSKGCPEDVTLQDFYDWKIKTTSSGLFHRRALFTSAIHWARDFWIEDLDFLMQLACLAPDGFRYLRGPFVDYEQRYGSDGLCGQASYRDWQHAFSRILSRHRSDPFMKNPHVFEARIRKYENLAHAYQAGTGPSPAARAFPAFFDNVNRRTLESYEKGVQAYLAKSPATPLPRVVQWLDAATKDLPLDAQIFEIGSGPGREALFLQSNGFSPRCSDATPAFVAHLRNQGLSAERFNILDDTLNGAFDLILANAVFLHFDLPDFKCALLKCARALTPRGRLALTLKEGAGEGWESSKIKAPRYFHFWNLPALEALFHESGLSIVWHAQNAEPETQENWIALVACRV